MDEQREKQKLLLPEMTTNGMPGVKVGENIWELGLDFERKLPSEEVFRLSTLKGQPIVLMTLHPERTIGGERILEAIQKNKLAQSLTDRGVNLIGVIRDYFEQNQKILQKYDLSFPLLDDSDNYPIHECFNGGTSCMTCRAYAIDSAGNIQEIIKSDWEKPDIFCKQITDAADRLTVSQKSTTLTKTSEDKEEE